MSVSRPRTCQTLQRSSGWTCGSVTSVMPSPTRSGTNHGSATGRSSTAPSVRRDARQAAAASAPARRRPRRGGRRRAAPARTARAPACTRRARRAPATARRRQRVGQRQLAVHGHDVVVVGHDDRCRHGDVAEPSPRVEAADRPPGLDDLLPVVAGDLVEAPPRPPRRWRQSFHRASAALVTLPIGTAPAIDAGPGGHAEQHAARAPCR